MFIRCGSLCRYSIITSRSYRLFVFLSGCIRATDAYEPCVYNIQSHRFFSVRASFKFLRSKAYVGIGVLEEQAFGTTRPLSSLHGWWAIKFLGAYITAAHPCSFLSDLTSFEMISFLPSDPSSTWWQTTVVRLLLVDSSRDCSANLHASTSDRLYQQVWSWT